MTREEADSILSYVAQNIISPLAFDETPAKEVWLRLSGNDFNKLCKFVYEATESDVENMDDRYFVEEVTKNNMSFLEVLNWYRNLYYKEGSNTERGIMANAINDLFMKYKKELAD